MEATCVAAASHRADGEGRGIPKMKMENVPPGGLCVLPQAGQAVRGRCKQAAACSNTNNRLVGKDHL